jgi:hypothetical protein
MRRVSGIEKLEREILCKTIKVGEGKGKGNCGKNSSFNLTVIILKSVADSTAFSSIVNVDEKVGTSRGRNHPYSDLSDNCDRGQIDGLAI